MPLFRVLPWVFSTFLFILHLTLVLTQPKRTCTEKEGWCKDRNNTLRLKIFHIAAFKKRKTSTFIVINNFSCIRSYQILKFQYVFSSPLSSSEDKKEKILVPNKNRLSLSAMTIKKTVKQIYLSYILQKQNIFFSVGMVSDM